MQFSYLLLIEVNAVHIYLHKYYNTGRLPLLLFFNNIFIQIQMLRIFKLKDHINLDLYTYYLGKE